MDQLESMRTFVAVADAASFTRAARSLDISTTAVTRQVSALEARLGTRLLQRTTRSVCLTESGSIFLERVRRILEDIDDAQSVVATHQQAPAGVLRIAVPVAFGLRHMSQLLKAFLIRFPQVTPNITLTNEPVDLIEQRVDLALVPDGDGYRNSLIMRRVAASPLRFVAAPAYLASRGMPVETNDCKRHVFLAREGVGMCVLESMARVPSLFAAKIVANNYAMVHRFALEGLGVAALPAYLVEGDLHNGRLMALLPTFELPQLNLNIAYASRRNLPAKVRVFVDFAVEYFQNERASAARPSIAPAQN